jgi:hypothetical protein
LNKVKKAIADLLKKNHTFGNIARLPREARPAYISLLGQKKDLELELSAALGRNKRQKRKNPPKKR